jgi:hypothetical protein
MFFMEYVSINLESWFTPAMDNAHTHTHTHTSPFHPGETEAARDRVKKGLRERDCETELHTQREI